MTKFLVAKMLGIEMPKYGWAGAKLAEGSGLRMGRIGLGMRACGSRSLPALSLSCF
jgi:hypothetical protein